MGQNFDCLYSVWCSCFLRLYRICSIPEDSRRSAVERYSSTISHSRQISPATADNVSCSRYWIGCNCNNGHNPRRRTGRRAQDARAHAAHPGVTSINCEGADLIVTTMTLLQKGQSHRRAPPAQLPEGTAQAALPVPPHR